MARRGMNKENHGMPGCRDGGWRNPEVEETTFAQNWERIFGKKKAEPGKRSYDSDGRRYPNGKCMVEGCSEPAVMLGSNGRFCMKHGRISEGEK